MGTRQMGILKFPSEQGIPNNVLHLEVEDTCVTLGSAGPTASIEDFRHELLRHRATGRDSPQPPALAKGGTQPSGQTLTNTSPRRPGASPAAAPSTRTSYSCPLSTGISANPSHRLIIADNIPGEVILDKHKHGFLQHVQKDRNWTKPSLTGPLKSSETQE